MRLRIVCSLFLMVSVAGALAGCESAGAVMDRGTAGGPAGTGFMIKTVHNDGRDRKYALFVPHAYRQDAPCPVIVFLHGVGEGGTDAQHNLTVGLAPVVAERAATFPFIVVFPQSASGHWDEDSNAAADAIAALDQVERDYSVDHQRVFLTGLSTGGYGTWAIGAKYKDHFTGLVPMCSYPDFKDVDKLTDMPIWCFHNSGDPFALAAGAHAMVDQVNSHGGHVKYTEYLALGHDVWVRAYQKDELYQWMLDTRKTTVARSAGRATITASVLGNADARAAAEPAVRAAPPEPVRAAPAQRAPAAARQPRAEPAPQIPEVSDKPVANPAPVKSDGYVPMVW